MQIDVSSAALNSGTQIPLLGLGTYKLCTYEALYKSISAALEAGYRAFDTAAAYDNEAQLGQVIRDLLPKHGLVRADVFLISKLGPEDHGPRAKEGCLKSLQQIGCEYIDLYLLHWPGVTGLEPTNPLHAKYRSQSWAALEEFYDSGKFKAIGVSNYTASHFLELLRSCRVPPAVLQMECHPKLNQVQLWNICRKAGVHFQAYSSLGKGALLQYAEVNYVAENRGRTPAQVLLRWAVQQGISVLPRSSHPQCVQENSRIFGFELSDKDMQRLFALNCDTRYCTRDSTFI
ncbi:NADPH-dependent aldo-keto reductase, chloroplastic [Bagarius yarrelli]|uniref:NADPH-dependent aldo-keto reductase, chloroplastic n=1 Tax=Bagarius yarrelli TaxID=175774 RepID=A0A556TX46_BAGYA|nr:NADPH-dependent aldo-keto reductase, chloroplastic [Bagarius yarrelli]